MTIKPKKPRSGKAFGTRRQYRERRGRLFASMDWFGDPAWLLDTSPTGRIIPDIKFMPMPDVSPWAELVTKIHEEMMTRMGLDFALVDALQLGETIIQTGTVRKIGKSPALAAPYGKPKDTD